MTVFPLTIHARPRREAALQQKRTPLNPSDVVTLSTLDGNDWRGTPEQIVRDMQSRALERGESLDAFITACEQRAERLGESIKIEGASDAERAASLLSEYLRLGWARRY